MKKNVNKIKFLLGILLISAVAPVSADLPSNFRKNFSKIVQDYCYSRTIYSLDDPIGQWTEDDGWEGQPKKFHDTINCIFESALEELHKDEKVRVEKAFKGTLPIETFQRGESCRPKFLQVVQGEQEAKGFDSECAKNEVPEISQVYSACRVAETVLQEWCGYDLFLYAKEQDENSFRQNGGDLGVAISGAKEFPFSFVQKKIREERTRTEKIVFEMITGYQETEKASRQSFWITALQGELLKIQDDWAKLRSALGTFIDKFVNASRAP